MTGTSDKLHALCLTESRLRNIVQGGDHSDGALGRNASKSVLRIGVSHKIQERTSAVFICGLLGGLERQETGVLTYFREERHRIAFNRCR